MTTSMALRRTPGAALRCWMQHRCCSAHQRHMTCCSDRALLGRVLSRSRCGAAVMMTKSMATQAPQLKRNKPDASGGKSEALQRLEQSLSLRQPAEALRYFEALRMPPDQVISQRLVILLAKAGTPEDTKRASEILHAIYMLPCFQPDDFTKLASIYLAEACLRHKLLDQALEVVNMAANAGVVIDLPALDQMVRALVHADRLEDAALLMRSMSANHDVAPTERIYFPLLAALVERQDYLTATFLLEFGRKHGSKFSSETFHPLVEMAEADEDTADALESFLSCIERMWDAVKALDALEDDRGHDEDEGHA